MGVQLIFCVESNKQKQTDYKYIKETVEYFYNFDRAEVRLNKTFMNGRGNYDSPRVEKEIQGNIKKYSSTSSDNKSVVIYCFDCDDYDTKPEDKAFLDRAEEYCRENEYKFVWFCKEIESVYWGKQVADDIKVKMANKFVKDNAIKAVSYSNLCSEKYKDKYSNLCRVIEDIEDKNGEKPLHLR